MHKIAVCEMTSSKWCLRGCKL